MKLAGVARFDCIGSTQEFTCYMAGLASPGDHACGWTTSVLHSRLAWRYWFRWVCGASSGTSPVVESSRVCAYRRPPATNALKHSPPSSRTRANHTVARLPLSRHGAGKHPLRRDAPVTSRCTRSEGVHCLRIGCTASSTSSLRVVFLAGTALAGVQLAQDAQHCTRYDSNALGRKALH